MKDTVASAAREVHDSVQSRASDFEQSWRETSDEVRKGLDWSSGADAASDWSHSSTGAELGAVVPVYRRNRKNWRLKRAAVPQWYKARNQVRSRALSGAARVARQKVGQGH